MLRGFDRPASSAYPHKAQIVLIWLLALLPTPQLSEIGDAVAVPRILASTDQQPATGDLSSVSAQGLLFCKRSSPLTRAVVGHSVTLTWIHKAVPLRFYSL